MIAGNLKVISEQKQDLEKTHKSLREAQAQIISQEKFRQAKDIAGGFAHEIRNALFPADGAYNLMFDDLQKKELSRERIEMLLRSAKRATSRAIGLTDQVLRYSKLETLRSPESINVFEIVSEALQDLREEIDSAKIVTEIRGSQGVRAIFNREQLISVVTNLLRNSVDALTNASDPYIFLEVTDEVSHVSLTVVDNGSGIPVECRDRVFDAFYSTKPESGTGLGLAMVKKMIELYDGSVSFSSEPNTRTEFRLTMQRSQVTDEDE
jgi:hypothetical protein